MFAESLLDAHRAPYSRRGWTTLISFSLQAVGVGVLLLLPLIYTEGLPKLQLLAAILPPAPPPGPPAPAHPARPSPQQQSNLFDGRLMEIRQIPTHVEQVTDTEPPPEIGPTGPTVPGGTGDPSTRGNVLNSIGSAPAILPKPPAPVARPVIVSHMMEGNLIYKPQPLYPPLARSARIQGAVVLRAIISKTGTIENLQVLSGHPMLVHAAIDAVSQWRYRPYVLNGDPIEVETQVTVNFVLSGG
jgi:periplasmic protein TonB